MAVGCTPGKLITQIGLDEVLWNELSFNFITASFNKYHLCHLIDIYLSPFNRAALGANKER